MENKILKFLFGWFYDFHAPDNKNNEMDNEESKSMMNNFDKLRFKNKTGKREWFVKR